jgi:predicted ATPase
VVRRFIIFVDSMYECNFKLVLHAEARLSELCSIEANSSSSDEAF